MAVGSKILISGGGWYGFTTAGMTPDRFISGNPHFARAALHRYRPANFLALAEKHRIHRQRHCWKTSSTATSQ